jgi:transketolase
MANTQEINDLQNPISKLDDLETKTNKTLDNLFTQEKTLIESIKDEKLKKAAQEEYEEMLNKYKQEKESIHQEVSKNILNDIKNEFKEDINSLQIILSNSNDLMKNEELYFDDEKGFETFIKLLNTNEKN